MDLRQAFEQADAERTRLKIDLADATKRLDAALTEAKTNTTELAASRQAVERLRSSLDFVAASLPPDPRGGSVEVRAARSDAQGVKLNYELLVFRDGQVVKKPTTKARKGTNPFTGEEMMFKAKPARKIVRARPVKAAKDAV